MADNPFGTCSSNENEQRLVKWADMHELAARMDEQDSSLNVPSSKASGFLKPLLNDTDYPYWFPDVESLRDEPYLVWGFNPYAEEENPTIDTAVFASSIDLNRAEWTYYSQDPENAIDKDRGDGHKLAPFVNKWLYFITDNTCICATAFKVIDGYFLDEGIPSCSCQNMQVQQVGSTVDSVADDMGLIFTERLNEIIRSTINRPPDPSKRDYVELLNVCQTNTNPQPVTILQGKVTTVGRHLKGHYTFLIVAEFMDRMRRQYEDRILNPDATSGVKKSQTVRHRSWENNESPVLGEFCYPSFCDWQEEYAQRAPDDTAVPGGPGCLKEQCKYPWVTSTCEGENCEGAGESGTSGIPEVGGLKVYCETMRDWYEIIQRIDEKTEPYSADRRKMGFPTMNEKVMKTERMKICEKSDPDIVLAFSWALMDGVITNLANFNVSARSASAEVQDTSNTDKIPYSSSEMSISPQILEALPDSELLSRVSELNTGRSVMALYATPAADNTPGPFKMETSEQYLCISRDMKAVDFQIKFGAMSNHERHEVSLTIEEVNTGRTVVSLNETFELEAWQCGTGDPCPKKGLACEGLIRRTFAVNSEDPKRGSVYKVRMIVSGMQQDCECKSDGYFPQFFGRFKAFETMEKAQQAPEIQYVNQGGYGFCGTVIPPFCVCSQPVEKWHVCLDQIL